MAPRASTAYVYSSPPMPRKSTGPRARRTPPRSAAGCSAGSAATAATCPGGAPAIRTASWSPSSCCSRPRCRGSRRTTTAFSSGIPPSRRWRGAAPRRCGRAGRGWATTAGPPTCTGWRRRWWTEHAGVIPADPAALRRLPGRGAIHRRGGGQLRLRARRRRRWTPTSPGCSGARSTRGCAGRARRAHALGDGAATILAGAGRRPGRSIRRSWSWERWSAPPGWRDAATARCGGRCAQGGTVAPERSEGRH